MRTPHNLAVVQTVKLLHRSGSGTSVYALCDASSNFPYEKVTKKFPGIRHFQCSFIGKANDLTSWY